MTTTVCKTISLVTALFSEKTALVDKSRVEPTIFFIEKISFSLKLSSGPFYGQSFIKTVRGPFARGITNRYSIIGTVTMRVILQEA